MSLLWRNHLRISLAAERLVLRANRGSLTSLTVPPAPHAAEWAGAVQALPQALAPYRKHDVSVVLADQFVRYTLLAWNAALKSEAQWLALARHRLEAVHGAAAADWEVRLTETAPAGPRLACAIDRRLVAELSAAVERTDARLVSVQPFLIAAFNRIRGVIRERSCWLVIEEPGRLTLGFIRRGTWLVVRSRRAGADWRAQLPQLIERESAFLALSEPCTRVIVCAQGAFDTGQYETWHTEAVDYGELALDAEAA